MEKIDKANISESEKELLNLIEDATVNENKRIYIGKVAQTHGEYIRGDEEKKNMVLVQYIREESGTTYHNYPGYTVENLSKHIQNKTIKSGDESFDRKALELRYKILKERLYQEIETMEIDEKDKDKVKRIIESICDVGKRMYIKSNDISFSEHLRIADESGWRHDGDKLGVQLVQSVRDENGVTDHNYPKKSLSDIIEYIREKEIIFEENSKDERE